MTRLLVAVLTLVMLPTVFAEEQALNSRAEQTLRKALDGMTALQVNGGWGMAWTHDGALTWGEYLPMEQSWICAQPPSTPYVAGVFLEAGKTLQDEALLERARMARDAIEAILTPEGGVPYQADPQVGAKETATLDDSVTTACLNFLVDWWEHTGAQKDLDLVHRVGGFLLDAQHPVGGWPQRYPFGKGYSRFITFNDGVTANVIDTLLMLHRRTKDDRYLEAAKRGGECIIKLQGPEGETIWAQQYDDETLEPAWARFFEPPGYTPAESVGACNALIDLYLATGEDRFLAPLPAAFEWYETHRLENGLYARLYEPGTQRPVYGRRDKKEKVYDFAEACSGYSWQANWYPHEAKSLYDRIQQEGREAVLAQVNAPKPDAKPEDMAQDVAKVCDELSEDGYWLSNPSDADREQYAKAGVPQEVRMIRTGDFAEKARLLLRYLKAVK